ncbi:MAG: hypothetical protein AB9866_05055 [Syntrophobacteraceae bacterium]
MHQGHEGDLVQLQCGREISREEIEEIRETVGVFQQLSREEPAVTICEHLEWFSASGSPKSDACLNLLLKLESEGLLKLPAKKTSLRKAPGKPYPTQRTEPVSPIEGSLRDIGRVRLEMVGGREETQLWNNTFTDTITWATHNHLAVLHAILLKAIMASWGACCFPEPPRL